MSRPSAATIRTRLLEADNDYRSLGRIYATYTGQDLAGDPFAQSLARRTDLPSVSVVIPAWNAAGTIRRCLRAIAESTFNEHHPERLQVVVVDDGSDDGTAEAISARPLPANMVVVRQPHCGRARAMNAGIAAADGDVVISCDADMLLTRHTIEELAQRHQILDGVLLIGFRSDVPPVTEPGGGADDGLAELLARPALLGDNRLSFDWPGWPENMVQASDELRGLGNGRRLWMPSGEGWSLPRMVFGCLFSTTRAALVALGGYDRRFQGWGWEDSELAARAIAAGHYIVPVYAASGFHTTHPARSPLKWHEAGRNRKLYQQLLDQPALGVPRLSPPQGRRPAGTAPERTAVAASPDLGSEVQALWTGRTLAAVGRLDEASEVLGNIDVDSAFGAEALLTAAIVRRTAGHLLEAIAKLRRASSQGGPLRTAVLAQLGLTQAAAGSFREAGEVLGRAYQENPRDRLLRYVLKCPHHRHMRRGQRYALQGDHALAVRDFEAVLIQAPDHRRAMAAREVCLAKLAAA